MYGLSCAVLLRGIDVDTKGNHLTQFRGVDGRPRDKAAPENFIQTVHVYRRGRQWHVGTNLRVC
jgi:hypothetical protein